MRVSTLGRSSTCRATNISNTSPTTVPSVHSTVLRMIFPVFILTKLINLSELNNLFSPILHIHSILPIHSLILILIHSIYSSLSPKPHPLKHTHPVSAPSVATPRTLITPSVATPCTLITPSTPPH